MARAISILVQPSSAGFGSSSGSKDPVSRLYLASRETNSTKTIRTDVWLHPTALRVFSRAYLPGGGGASQRVSESSSPGNSFGNERRRAVPSCFIKREIANVLLFQTPSLSLLLLLLLLRSASRPAHRLI